ncbi:hypothetical protein CQA62_00905 [Helicobacter cholecystus]|uniref:Lipoprotein n=1 Tax=Helicobacter cholecystus TaxID=45498 RepID=A0A3D8IY74_9HELI|nr:hypothetical protein [Helicobacter cholecystus]RDU70003.1 hypothetical protein CQA62_00905 [Helicobacter cholecystus]VEJ24827.1 Uncharacterised protein [Helicobacter cholecystus]
MGYAILGCLFAILFLGCSSDQASIQIIQSPTSAPSRFTQEQELEAIKEDSLKLEDIPLVPQEQIIQIQ